MSEFSKRSSTRCGLAPYCKPCSAKAYAQASAERPEVAIKRKLRWRTNQKAKYQESNRRYYEATKAKYSEAKRLKRLADAEAYRAKARAKYHADPSAQKIATAKWASANKGRLREYYLRHYEANKAQYMLRGTRRRALKLKATIQKFSDEQLNARMSVFGFACAYCGGAFDHVDHVKPLSKGGPHCLSNLRPACKKCNLNKSAKLPTDWLRNRHQYAVSSAPEFL